MPPENPPKVITLGYGPDTDLWPFTLLDGAASYLRVADNAVAGLAPIAANNPDYLTVLFLLGHSLELSLKTYLRFRARYEQELLDLGHSLPAIFDEATRDGFPRGHACDRKILNLLDLTYASRKLLYPRAAAVSFPFVRPVRDLAVEYLRLASGGSKIWPNDLDSAYGTPSLAELRQHSKGTDLRQLAAMWIESEETKPPTLAANPAE